MALKSCKHSDLQINGLKKLSHAEMLERAGNGFLPDMSKITYKTQSGDTLTMQDLAQLDYEKIAFDDYVDDNGEVRLAIVRELTKSDSLLRLN